MTDRGYWARLGLEGIEDHPHDHPMGFTYGTIGQGVLPRLAVLLDALTTPAQFEAFNALWRELGHYGHQTHRVIEGLREMARDLKNLEDNVSHEYQNLQQLRDLYCKFPDKQRFDDEVYKRSSIVNRDLESYHFDLDWEYQAAVGRRLDQRLAEEEARKHQEALERQLVWAKEQKEKVEAGLLARLGVLYKTSPAGIDRSIPKNVRQDMAAAEKRLAAMGFDIQVDGHVHCCTKTWGEFVVYGDPRSGNSLKFSVFKGSQQIGWFWVKDQTRNPVEKLEAQLNELSGSPSSK